MELKNKRVLVVGLGRSGVSSAIFLQEHGAKVIVSDSKAEAQLQSEVPALLDRGISIETGRHGEHAHAEFHAALPRWPQRYVGAACVARGSRRHWTKV